MSNTSAAQGLSVGTSVRVVAASFAPHFHLIGRYGKVSACPDDRPVSEGEVVVDLFYDGQAGLMDSDWHLTVQDLEKLA